jgi:hypothetical protein
MSAVTPLDDPKKPGVVSAGFTLWKDPEVRLGRTLKLEGIAKEVGLAPMTVRRFCAAPGTDVSSATLNASTLVFRNAIQWPISIEALGPGELLWSYLAAAARLARYFGVPLDTLVHEAPGFEPISMASGLRNGAAVSPPSGGALLRGSSD